MSCLATSKLNGTAREKSKMSEEWFWEGNIVQTLCKYLQEKGWAIHSVADVEKREPGVDIHARMTDKVLLIEVKGYPSTMYERGEKKGQAKKTNPATQARHWYGEVLLSAILRQTEDPNAIIAIALPDFSTFTKMVERTHHALVKLGIVVYIVKESGSIEVINPT